MSREVGAVARSCNDTDGLPSKCSVSRQVAPTYRLRGVSREREAENSRPKTTLGQNGFSTRELGWCGYSS